MLYLTLQDDPFPDQTYDESALLELVRSVARRDAEDRTLSELVRFQDALERLGMLWTPLDHLDKDQSLQLVRNLHLELGAPGDMLYLKHSPAMRSYVVLRGTVLLCKNVLDRDGAEGIRVLEAGGEFGAPLDPDFNVDEPISGFEEYAKAAPLENYHEAEKDTTSVAAPRGGRRDGRTELLVIGRQDWSAAIKCSSANFEQMVAKDAAGKKHDPLKDRARVAFNLPAKGRLEEHLTIARQYLTERVPFCKDLPDEQVSAMAAALELRALNVPGRVVFRSGRECYGEAYIMFTGTADITGGERSRDRLIREGNLFGDEHFGSGAKDVQETPFRTATAVSRTAPCELLVLPTRECRRLREFVAERNSEKAMVVFQKVFHNISRRTLAELSSLATFRQLNMHEKLAVKGDSVSAVFFVFRGECTAKGSTEGETETDQRYGPGHIVGWRYVMPSRVNPKRNFGSGGGGIGTANATSDEQQRERRRKRWRHEKEWNDTVTITTPAQVLSVPVTRLLEVLSKKALSGLRSYISLTHEQQHSEEDSWMAVSQLNDPDDAGDGTSIGSSAIDCAVFDIDAFFGDRTESDKGRRKRDERRPNTTPIRASLGSLHNWRTDVARRQSHSRARDRWRVGITDGIRAASARSCPPKPTTSVAIWGSALNRSEEKAPRVWGDCECSCPIDRCLVCSPTRRLERFRRTPAWVPSLPLRGTTPTSPTSPTARAVAAGSTPSTAVRHEVDKVTGECENGDILGSVIQRTGTGSDQGSEYTAVPFGEGTLDVSHGDCATPHTPKDGVEVVGVTASDDGLKSPCQGMVETVCRKNMGEEATTTVVDHRSEDRVYTLVQLSTRGALDASDPSAALCLRILGSFEFEVDATNRILNLYHNVLPDKLLWRPYQVADATDARNFQNFSDHIFLARKGTPAKSISFNVGAPSIGVSAEGSVNAIEQRGGVGRGYDAILPSVFKAKAQNFAIALVPSADRIEQEWEELRTKLEERHAQEKEADEAQRKANEAVAGTPVAPPVQQETGVDIDFESVARRSFTGIDHGSPLSAKNDCTSSDKSGHDGAEMIEEGETTAPEDVRRDGEHATTEELGEAAGGTGNDREKDETKPGEEPIDDEGVEKERDATTVNEDCHDRACNDENKVSKAAGAMTDPTMGLQSNASSGFLVMLGNSDTESSDADEACGTINTGKMDGTASWLELASIARDDCSEDGHGDTGAVVAWMSGRMGLLEKVEGCYETEATAFRRAVEILEGMEIAACGVHIAVGSSTSALAEISQHQPPRRVCVLPLYKWLSLGDGKADGAERAIQDRSVSDPAEATRAGVNPATVWTNQRARTLRTNLYNLLRSAGPREIRSRCRPEEMTGRGIAGRGTRGKRAVGGRGVFREDGTGQRGENKNTGRSLRKNRGHETMQSARASVLKQNQKLIQTEMKVRRRSFENSSGSSLHGPLASKPEIVGLAGTRHSTDGNSKPRANNTADDAGARKLLEYVTGTRSAGGASRRFRGGRGYRGDGRHKLRMQMKIERKRARLFEDIRLLPYIGAQSARATNGTLLADQGNRDITSPAIVRRVAMVKAQTCLHGKPAASFFSRVHAAGTVDTATKTINEETEYPANTSLKQSTTAEISKETEMVPTAVEPSVVGFRAHSARSGGRDIEASAYASSNTSNPDTAGGVSVTDLTTVSASTESIAMRTGDVTELLGTSGMHRRNNRTCPRGRGRRRAKEWDGWSTPTAPKGVCTLDGELVLLDGVLHDSRVRTWVETALAPANRRLKSAAF